MNTLYKLTMLAIGLSLAVPVFAQDSNPEPQTQPVLVNGEKPLFVKRPVFNQRKAHKKNKKQFQHQSSPSTH